ncbi:hypothetical protein BFJ66_g16856 [Fusarium oxysporum f. sp. cepae]|nr:hypothetical protein BFJ66_g16856 [Fusarium oxysporum f. sp. cepae]
MPFTAGKLLKRLACDPEKLSLSSETEHYPRLSHKLSNEAEVSGCREMQAEYCDRCLKKGVNRVGDREDIREDNTEDEEEEEEEDEGEDEEEDNDDEAERVPAVTIVNRLKENIQEESRRMIKLYGWLD